MLDSHLTTRLMFTGTAIRPALTRSELSVKARTASRQNTSKERMALQIYMSKVLGLMMINSKLPWTSKDQGMSRAACESKSFF